MARIEVREDTVEDSDFRSYHGIFLSSVKHVSRLVETGVKLVGNSYVLMIGTEYYTGPHSCNPQLDRPFAIVPLSDVSDRDAIGGINRRLYERVLSCFDTLAENVGEQITER